MSKLEDNKGTYKKYTLVHQEGRLKCKNNLEGTISRKETIEKAEREFEIYREREMRLLESDFDKAVKALMENNKTREGNLLNDACKPMFQK